MWCNASLFNVNRNHMSGRSSRLLLMHSASECWLKTHYVHWAFVYIQMYSAIHKKQPKLNPQKTTNQRHTEGSVTQGFITLYNHGELKSIMWDTLNTEQEVEATVDRLLLSEFLDQYLHVMQLYALFSCSTSIWLYDMINKLVICALVFFSCTYIMSDLNSTESIIMSLAAVNYVLDY